MAEGLHTPQSAEGEGDHGNAVNANGQLLNGDGDGENAMEVDDQQNVVGDVGVDPNLNGGSGSGAASGDGREPTVAQEQGERKITQTDHINKSLLTSFLDRLNDPATAAQFPVVQSLDTDFDDDADPVNH